MWALTGHQLIPQAGPVKDVNDTHPLYEPAAPEGQLKDTRLKVARRWPPVIAYPWNIPSEDITVVKGRAEVIVTFTDDAGNTTELHRSLSEDGVMEEPDFTALGVPDIAVEIAVMMPNRIPFIGVNANENEIAALVKLLGLEPLGGLADHVSVLIHGNTTFMRSPSARDITDAERRFQKHVGRTDEALRGLSVTVAPKAALYVAARDARDRRHGSSPRNWPDKPRRGFKPLPCNFRRWAPGARLGSPRKKARSRRAAPDLVVLPERVYQRPARACGLPWPPSRCHGLAPPRMAGRPAGRPVPPEKERCGSMPEIVWIASVAPVKRSMRDRVSRSAREAKDTAMPEAPARPVRPMRWT